MLTSLQNRGILGLLSVSWLVVCLASPVGAQTLSPTLELKRQILVLQAQLAAEQAKTATLTGVVSQCLAQSVLKMDPLVKAFQAEVEAAHPGFTYDVPTGTFTPKPKAR